MSTTLPPIYSHEAPVVIGGLGGSGTRLIAQCVRELGFFIGTDLNKAYDNLWFTLLFKRIDVLFESEKEFDDLVDVFMKAMTCGGDFETHQIKLLNNLVLKNKDRFPEGWLQERMYRLVLSDCSISPGSEWGWKEPNSHIVLDRLNMRFRKMKYIHVIRNGLDMAYSDNQNQLRLWGDHFIREDFDVSPYYALRFWCITHQRIIDIGAHLEERFLLLNYDDFCSNPKSGVQNLCDFLEIDVTPLLESTLLSLIRIPDSIDRFKCYSRDLFDQEDIRYVSELGFKTN